MNTQQAREAEQRFENVDPEYKKAIVETVIEEIAKATNVKSREAVLTSLKFAAGVTAFGAFSVIAAPIALVFAGLAGLATAGIPAHVIDQARQAGKSNVEKMNVVLTKMNATTDKQEQKSIMLEAYPALYARFPRVQTQARVADVLPASMPASSGGGSSVAALQEQIRSSGGGSSTHRPVEERPMEPLNWEQWQEQTRRIVKEKKQFEPKQTRE